MDPIVIVGSGLAGYGLARELRKIDRELPVVIVTRDSGDYYAKPSLSNALANRKSPDELVTAAGPEISRQLGVTLSEATLVEAIDRQRNELVTSRGRIAYSKLVLATGADPVRLPLAGDAAASVVQVNDLDDYRAFRAAIEGRSRVAIIGAGLIGCEFADDLRADGIEVTVVDPMPRPLAALLPEPAGHWYAQRLARSGVGWIFGDAVEAVNRGAAGLRLTLRSGRAIEADVVLSAVGLRPRTALARDAGLAVGRGIAVDASGRTSDGSIHALGDCAQFEGRVLPYVAPILAASRAIAATLCGTPAPIRFATTPVIVKTPSCPAAIVAPAASVPGQWRTEQGGDALAMRFRDEQGRLRGFALLGAATNQRNAMLREIATTAQAQPS